MCQGTMPAYTKVLAPGVDSNHWICGLFGEQEYLSAVNIHYECEGTGTS